MADAKEKGSLVGGSSFFSLRRVIVFSPEHRLFAVASSFRLLPFRRSIVFFSFVASLAFPVSAAAAEIDLWIRLPRNGWRGRNPSSPGVSNSVTAKYASHDTVARFCCRFLPLPGLHACSRGKVCVKKLNKINNNVHVIKKK